MIETETPQSQMDADLAADQADAAAILRERARKQAEREARQRAYDREFEARAAAAAVESDKRWRWYNSPRRRARAKEDLAKRQEVEQAIDVSRRQLAAERAALVAEAEAEAQRRHNERVQAAIAAWETRHSMKFSS